MSRTRPRAKVGAAQGSGAAELLINDPAASNNDARVLLSSSFSQQAAGRSDWAKLPLDVCQQILRRNLVAYCLGTRVCKAWRTAQRAGSCKPLRIDLGAAALGDDQLFPGSAGAAEGWFISDILDKQAPNNLQELLLATPWSYDGLQRSLAPRLARFTNLHRFDLKLEASCKWTDMISMLSSELKSLTLDEVSAKYEDAACHLEIFGKFANLELLKLCYGDNVDHDDSGLFEDEGYPDIVGDLDLPHLTELEINVNMDRPLIAPNLTLDHVPLSCHVICELEVRTRAARKRLGPKKKKRKEPRRWMLPE